MRRWLPILLVLPLAHCSCQHSPPPPATAEASAPPVATPADPAPATAATAEPARAAQESAAAREALATLHAYLGALPGDPARADTFWAGGRPNGGDAPLRELAGLRAMRVDNGRPRPLDDNRPPRAFEIPVHLRLDVEAGPARVAGWYRLRARATGGWEISSASLRPELD